MTRLRALLAYSLVLAAVTPLATALTVTTTAPAGAAYGRLRPPMVVPVAGSGFELTGHLASKVRRTVKLQELRGGRYVTIATKKSTRVGDFAFKNVVLDGPTSLRVRAPRHKVNPRSRGLKSIVTKPVDVDVHGQSSQLTALPPIAQQGPTPADPVDAAQVVARFSPARPGRVVHLERLTGDRWVTVQAGAQDPAGTAVFSVPDTATYRATAISSVEGLAPETTSTVAPRIWKPIFEETFSGTALNTAVWSDQPRENNPDGQRTCARDDSATRHVSGGVLHLGVGYDQTRPGQSCGYTSAYGSGSTPYLTNSQVATETSFAFKYGFAAARMKLQRGKGMHSGFWMLPDFLLLPPCDIEVDVMEFFGESPRAANAVGSFLHECTPGGQFTKYGDVFKETAAMKPAGDTWWDSFHVFSVEWTPSEYVFRVDGAEFYRETRAISHEPAFLILSMLTSDYELRHLTPDRMSQTAQVDWVRVYQ
ncbi:glycoside hydrolase family 16 protein [Nocardioides allogilvus]|uniref:glycoside hydrolase family 16 protein n=1 Tax=Nocardioides allogilvus TaxID=2072017 RepID=UPI000D300F3F|nr:glycoside hydrolase family 16 protein [Nocardioides allogilvus]